MNKTTVHKKIFNYLKKKLKNINYPVMKKMLNYTT